MSAKVLKPSFLISLVSRVRGGAEYRRTDRPTETDAAGRQVSSWETTKIIDDPAEFEAAGKVRGNARSLIARTCAKTAFGTILPLESEAAFDADVAEARELVSRFNAGAATCHIHLPIPLKGRIAESTAEAVAAIRSETAALLEEMGRMASFEGAPASGDTEDTAERVAALRDIANRGRQLERLYEQQSAARGALAAAITAARTTARAITKRVVKEGESLEAVLKEANLAPIATARRVFLEPLSEEAGEEIGPQNGADEPGEAVDGLPAVPLARFVDLEDLPEPAEEPPFLFVVIPDFTEAEHAAFEQLFQCSVAEYFREHQDQPDLEARVRVDLAGWMEQDAASDLSDLVPWTDEPEPADDGDTDEPTAASLVPEAVSEQPVTPVPIAGLDRLTTRYPQLASAAADLGIPARALEAEEKE